MADPIATLPVDDSPEVPEDTQLLERFVLLENQKETAGRLFATNRDILVASALFLILSLPAVDGLIEKVYPACAERFYYRLGIKTLIFLILLFVLNNLRYIVKSSAN